MTYTPKRFREVQNTGSFNFTLSNDNDVILKQVIIADGSGSDNTVNLTLQDSGSTPLSGILSNYPLKANDTVVIDLSLPVNAGERFSFDPVGPASITVSGVEIT